jgi:anti-sigma factor RsiW
MPRNAEIEASVIDADDLTCQELVDLITDYLEKALPPAERQRVAAHLATCADCADYLGQMRVTLRLLGQLTPEPAPVAARDRLLNLFRHWKAPGGRAQ